MSLGGTSLTVDWAVDWAGPLTGPSYHSLRPGAKPAQARRPATASGNAPSSSFTPLGSYTPPDAGSLAIIGVAPWPSLAVQAGPRGLCASKSSRHPRLPPPPTPPRALMLHPLCAPCPALWYACRQYGIDPPIPRDILRWSMVRRSMWPVVAARRQLWGSHQARLIHII